MNLDLNVLIENAFANAGLVITDKGDRTALRWAEATLAGSILGQSKAQCDLEELIGGENAVVILSAIGKHL